LYFRLLLTLLRAWRAPAITIGQTLERSFRVLPNDIDVNSHMNNGRYLTLIDLMLIEYFARIGFVTVLLRKRWRPMSGGAFITYRRGLKPFQMYRIRYRIDACDKHWNFMRFEFLDGDKLCASGYMKGAAVGAKGLITNEVSYAELNQTVLKKPLPVAVEHWLAAEKALIATPW
jgi:acyl-CoA thioesterase FadM